MRIVKTQKPTISIAKDEKGENTSLKSDDLVSLNFWIMNAKSFDTLESYYNNPRKIIHGRAALEPRLSGQNGCTVDSAT